MRHKLHWGERWRLTCRLAELSPTVKVCLRWSSRSSRDASRSEYLPRKNRSWLTYSRRFQPKKGSSCHRSLLARLRTTPAGIFVVQSWCCRLPSYETLTWRANLKCQDQTTRASSVRLHATSSESSAHKTYGRSEPSSTSSWQRASPQIWSSRTWPANSSNLNRVRVHCPSKSNQWSSNSLYSLKEDAKTGPSQ